VAVLTKLVGLKPVTFHYKSDNTNTPQFGLIAEEVAEVNSELVVRDDNGEIYTGALRRGERDVAQRVPQRASGRL
jgi:Chaperone of endosialidase